MYPVSRRSMAQRFKPKHNVWMGAAGARVREAYFCSAPFSVTAKRGVAIDVRGDANMTGERDLELYNDQNRGAAGSMSCHFCFEKKLTERVNNDSTMTRLNIVGIGTDGSV